MGSDYTLVTVTFNVQQCITFTQMTSEPFATVSSRILCTSANIPVRIK